MHSNCILNDHLLTILFHLIAGWPRHRNEQLGHAKDVARGATLLSSARATAPDASASVRGSARMVNLSVSSEENVQVSEV